MVRAAYLTPEHLIRAMEQADFYASSGVELESIHFDNQTSTLAVQIPATDGVEFTTEFIGSEKPEASGELPPPDSIGKVFATVKGTTATYTCTGKELYVRARITSSRPHDDPSIPDQLQQAWTQPVVP